MDTHDKLENIYSKLKGIEIDLIVSLSEDAFKILFGAKAEKLKRDGYNILAEDSTGLSVLEFVPNSDKHEIFIFRIQNNNLSDFYTSIKLNANNILVNDSERLDKALGEKEPTIEIDLDFRDMTNIYNSWSNKAREKGLNVPANLNMRACTYIALNESGIRDCLKSFDLSNICIDDNTIPYINQLINDIFDSTYAVNGGEI